MAPLDPPEAPAEVQQLLSAFVADFNAAAAGGDVDWLYERLAPPVIDVYGEDACRLHVADVMVDVGSLTLEAPARGPVARVVEVPRPEGGTVTLDLRDIYFADISFAHDGETTSQTGWVQIVDDPEQTTVTYFARCALVETAPGDAG